MTTGSGTVLCVQNEIIANGDSACLFLWKLDSFT